MFKLHVFWHESNRGDGKDNYGDALAPFICGKLSGKAVTKAKLLKGKKYRYFIKHYFTIGSIIKRVVNNSIVWGSGIIKKDEAVPNARFFIGTWSTNKEATFRIGLHRS